MRKSLRNKLVYTYPIEVLKKYSKIPTRWKLVWLEEANKLTFRVLTPKQKALREKIRKGLLP